jgi:ankyrin repeat protein
LVVCNRLTLLIYIQFGKTALMYAAEFGHPKCVKVLLERNAEVNTVSKVSLMRGLVP